MGSIVGRWPLVPGSIGTLVASDLNGHCPISFSHQSKIVRCIRRRELRDLESLGPLVVPLPTLGTLHPALGFLVPSTLHLTYI